MDCPDVCERLPWFLNGTLEGPERESVRGHLEGCARCREELARTRGASALFDAHVPREGIVALALNEPLDQAQAEEFRFHLADCPDCAGDLALTREGFRAVETAERSGITPTTSVSRRYRLPAVAAALLVATLGGSVIWQGRLASSRLEIERKRVTDLESELSSLRPEAVHAAELQRQLDELQRIQTNVPLVELLPRESSGRGAATDAGRTLRPAGPFAVLSLVVDSSERYDDYRLEMADAGGAVLWTAGGLSRQPDGDITALIPTTGLRSGPYALRLGGRRGRQWTALASYSLQVQAGSSPPSAPSRAP